MQRVPDGDCNLANLEQRSNEIGMRVRNAKRISEFAEGERERERGWGW